MAVANYESANGSLPPAFVKGPDGAPWHSWRVLILPWIEQAGLYNAYNFAEPWNGPNNSRLLARMPTIYQTPDNQPNPQHSTSYVVVVGRHTAFPTDGNARELDEIKDGTANTMLAIEVADSRIPWMAPADFHFDRMSFRVNDGTKRGPGSHLGGARIALLDGSIRHVDDDFAPAKLRALLTADGGESVEQPGEKIHGPSPRRSGQ